MLRMRSGIAASLSLVWLVMIASVAAQTGASVRFRFAFGTVPAAGANPALVRITQDTTLKTGDQLKMLVELQQPGFLYVIYRAPNNDLDVLYPADLKKGAPVGQKQFIPSGTGWFKLDDPAGDETFYVLGSVQRLNELEALLGRHAAAPAAGKTAIVTEIVAEIRRLRTLHRNVAAPVERPVLIGGNVRSLGKATTRELPDVSTIAVDITAATFYARTYTVTHK